MSYLIYGILIYLGIMFIFRFVIPVYLATRKFKKGFREMKDRMEQQMKEQQQPRPQATERKPPPHADYIDFEEIK
jgi:hypothetical protein